VPYSRKGGAAESIATVPLFVPGDRQSRGGGTVDAQVLQELKVSVCGAVVRFEAQTVE
jgi:hypothetical protein